MQEKEVVDTLFWCCHDKPRISSRFIAVRTIEEQLRKNRANTTMMSRYKAACDTLDTSIEYITMESYGHIRSTNNIDLSKFDTFICATETIALETYKYILKCNITNYQILSAGNNRNINFIIDNLSTVDFHYKEAGRYIINNLKTKNKFEHVTKYDLVINE